MLVDIIVVKSSKNVELRLEIAYLECQKLMMKNITHFHGPCRVSERLTQALLFGSLLSASWQETEKVMTLMASIQNATMTT